MTSSRLSALPCYEVLRFDDNGERVYASPIGRCHSVTTILSDTRDNTQVQLWRESIGPERADFIRDLASFRGTQVHTAIENYLLKGELPAFSFITTPYWKSIYPFIETVEQPVLMEGAVWHPSGYAGTLDCIAYLPGDGDQPTLLDWKTADKSPASSPMKMYEYSLQVAAYVAAANYVYAQFGLNITSAKVVVALPDTGYYSESYDADALKQLFMHFQARLQRFTFARQSK